MSAMVWGWTLSANGMPVWVPPQLCPRCGARTIEVPRPQRWRCRGCGVTSEVVEAPPRPAVRLPPPASRTVLLPEDMDRLAPVACPTCGSRRWAAEGASPADTSVGWRCLACGHQARYRRPVEPARTPGGRLGRLFPEPPPAQADNLGIARTCPRCGAGGGGSGTCLRCGHLN